MKYKLKTINGYDFYEVSSAFQKSVRRGLEDDALFWAVELFESNYSEYLWKRIRIICSEDIGLAVPGLASEILALYEFHKELSKKKEDGNRPWRLFLVHAVLRLCRAEKSRTIDWALLYNWGCHQNRKRPIPDYAYDKHNDRGRQMGRGWGHFFKDGTILIKGDGKSEDEYKDLAKSAIDGTCGTGLFS
jgi:replication-associated recombination protein RarA